jgi:2-polyprenyl-3-methyl-5-hydroxy-6-metoxy-1,4-benzoquinol methylase
VTAARRCPLCQAETVDAFTVGDRNRGIGDSRFAYRRCRSCRTTFLAEVPANLSDYYGEDYYVFPSPSQLDRAASGERSKLDLLLPWAKEGRLIEIGAGCGLFAWTARRAGFDVTAIEMDGRCCSYIDEVLGVRAIQSDAPEKALAELAPSRVIVAWHVFEHLPRPWEVLEQAAGQLEPGGVLALAMPNPDSLQFQVLGARWAHVDAPRHLFLIPYQALKARAEELGLTAVLVTSDDPAARHWNAFGWEYALRGLPARVPSTPVSRAGGHALALCAAPFERRDLRGTAYTAIFVKR